MRGTGNFIDGLAFNAQGDQQAAYLRIRGIARHHLPHYRGHLIHGQAVAVNQFGQCLLYFHSY